jgi:hypothetical protein
MHFVAGVGIAVNSCASKRNNYLIVSLTQQRGKLYSTEFLPRRPALNPTGVFVVFVIDHTKWCNGYSYSTSFSPPIILHYSATVPLYLGDGNDRPSPLTW